MKSILFFVYKGKTRRGGEEQKRRGKRKRWRRRRSNNIPLFSPPRGKRSRTSVSTISSPPVSLLPLPLLSEIHFPLLSFHDRKLPSKVRKLGEEWCEVACVCVPACVYVELCVCVSERMREPWYESWGGKPEKRQRTHVSAWPWCVCMWHLIMRVSISAFVCLSVFVLACMPLCVRERSLHTSYLISDGSCPVWSKR